SRSSAVLSHTIRVEAVDGRKNLRFADLTALFMYSLHVVDRPAQDDRVDLCGDGESYPHGEHHHYAPDTPQERGEDGCYYVPGVLTHAHESHHGGPALSV